MQQLAKLKAVAAEGTDAEYPDGAPGPRRVGELDIEAELRQYDPRKDNSLRVDHRTGRANQRSNTASCSKLDDEDLFGGQDCSH